MNRAGLKKFEKILGSLNLPPDEFEKIMRAVADLESGEPRLNEERVGQIAQKVAEQMVADFKANFPPAKIPSVEEKFKKVAVEIAIGLVTSGIWGILSYLAQTQVLHFASAGDDWKSAHAGRLAKFASSRAVGQHSFVTLGREEELLLCVQAGYLADVVAQLKENPELKPLAEAVSKELKWDERSMEVFFYEVLTKKVYRSLIN